MCCEWHWLEQIIEDRNTVKTVVHMIKRDLHPWQTHWTAARCREAPQTAAAEEMVLSERPDAPSPSGGWWTRSSPAAAASEGFWWWNASETAPSSRSQPAGTPRPPSGLRTSTEREGKTQTMKLLSHNHTHQITASWSINNVHACTLWYLWISMAPDVHLGEWANVSHPCHIYSEVAEEVDDF